MTATYSRLIRFLSPGSTTPLIGEPVDKDIDVGVAVYSGVPVLVYIYSGDSILRPGDKIGEQVSVERLLSPLGQNEVGTIRCIGLNVSQAVFESLLPLMNQQTSEPEM